MNHTYDIIVVGMGPAAIFTAYELVQLKTMKKILLIDQGKRVEKRFCPLEKTKECVKCKPFCNITSGFSGAGAFSDGKLSLYNPEDDDIYVGGNLQNYIGVEQTKHLIDYVDNIYLQFGADSKLEGLKYKKEVSAMQQQAKEVGLDLISIPIRHLGTEKAHELYKKIEDYLEDHKIDMMFETVVEDLIIKDGKISGVKVKSAINGTDNSINMHEIYADKVVVAVGRKGANWLVDMCEKHKIKTKPGIVDIGVRYELLDDTMKKVNQYMYEGKFVGRPMPFKDKVRTFCQNPSGFVSEEVYDEGISLVNGHCYKEKKSTNTNLAILVSHHFTYPFHQPIEYGRNVAKNINELGNGNVLVQRLGDILKGKRTWEQELKTNGVQPTLKSATAGDITFAIGYRTMTDILQFINLVDKVIPGFANPDNLLYAPEIKFYSNQVEINNEFETNIEGLYSIGDGGGMTRGLMMASCSGVAMARILNQK